MIAVQVTPSGRFCASNEIAGAAQSSTHQTTNDRDQRDTALLPDIDRSIAYQHEAVLTRVEAPVRQQLSNEGLVELKCYRANEHCSVSLLKSRADAMNASSQDIDKTLEYRTATAISRLLPTGLLLIFLGLLIFVLADPAPTGTIIGVVLCLVVGIALVGLALWRRVNHGKPLFTFSPDGIHYRIPWVKTFNIPWTEIRGVDSIDVEAGYWSFWDMRYGFSIPDYNVAIYHNVAVVLVSKQFYDSRMFVASFFLRGPGWRANFIPKGSLVQVALHHDLVSVEPRLLREAVEARWLAFRDQPGKTSVPSVALGQENATAAPKRPAARAARGTVVVAMGENPKAVSRWQVVASTVLLIGIAAMLANLVGLWDLPGQSEVREVRTKARAEQKDWADSIRRNREESRKLEAEQKELRRQLDEDMRRMFSR